ncbi:MAG: hypothetical protein IT373_27425 [Polyangiaceae bacterium]|nr:hypothetical protein [Polyangiaceae bacterium]
MGDGDKERDMTAAVDEEEDFQRRLAVLEATEARFRAALRTSGAAGRTRTTSGVRLAVDDGRSAARERAELGGRSAPAPSGNLAGSIAHECNNLLGVILACADLALDGLPAGDPARSDLTEIKGAAGRAATLMRQLLALGRTLEQRPSAPAAPADDLRDTMVDPLEADDRFG